MDAENEKLDEPDHTAWGHTTQASSALEHINVRRMLNVIERGVGQIAQHTTNNEISPEDAYTRVTAYLEYSAERKFIKPEYEVQVTKVTGWCLSTGPYPVVLQSWSDKTTTVHGRHLRGSRRRLRMWARAHQNDVVINTLIRPYKSVDPVSVNFKGSSHHD